MHFFSTLLYYNKNRFFFRIYIFCACRIYIKKELEKGWVEDIFESFWRTLFKFSETNGGWLVCNVGTLAHII